VGRHCRRCVGRPSCFATQANRKQLLTFLRKLFAQAIKRAAHWGSKKHEGSFHN
jgi:hypothetical protein